MSMEDGRSAFNRRSEEALARRRMPAESTGPIELPDLHVAEQDTSQREPAPSQEQPPIPEEPTRSSGSFELLADHVASGSYGNFRYRYVLPDGTYEKNPDGSEKIFSQDEMARASGGGVPPEAPSAAATQSPEPQNVGKIAIEVPGQYVSWRERNNDPLLYDGIPLRNTRAILADSRESQLFGELLQAVGGENKTEVLARLERYKNGNPSQDDMEFMTYATKEFSRSMKFAEDAASQIRPDDIELFSRRNKDIENMFIQEGVDRAGDIVKNSIFHMAMRNPEGVAKLVGELQKQKENQDSPKFQKWNSAVKDLCNSVGLKNVQSFDTMYNMSRGERIATRERVRARVREDMNIFEKAVDMAAGRFGLSKTDRLMRKADWAVRMKQKHVLAPTSWKVSNVNEALTGITGFLGQTVGNDEIRSLVAQEVMENKSYATRSERGPKSFLEMRRLSSEDSIRTNLRERIQNDPAWASGGEAYQNAKLSEWKAETLQQSGGVGFWSWLFGFVFGKEFNKAATSVAGRPITV